MQPATQTRPLFTRPLFTCCISLATMRHADPLHVLDELLLRAIELRWMAQSSDASAGNKSEMVEFWDHARFTTASCVGLLAASMAFLSRPGAGLAGHDRLPQGEASALEPFCRSLADFGLACQDSMERFARTRDRDTAAMLADLIAGVDTLLLASEAEGASHRQDHAADPGT